MRDFATFAAVASVALGLIAAAAMTAAAEPAPRPAAPGALPDEPVNQWVLKSMIPVHVWENDMVYDPVTGRVVYQGGHVGRLYPQSNYTFLYEVARNRWRESQSTYRPQRRCFNNMAWLDSCLRSMAAGGSHGHGAIPQGWFSKEHDAYRECYRSTNYGPWLYDGVEDEWTDTRMLPPRWSRKNCAQLAYERNSDVAFYLYHSQGIYYCPRTNRLSTRRVPDELVARSGYAIAADPVRRKVVVFGGIGTYHFPKDRQDLYEKLVHNDTWVYDIATDAWHQARSRENPAGGYPMYQSLMLRMVYHHASGTMLLLQSPVDKLPLDTANLPPPELWSFDLDGEQWTRLPVKSDGASGPSFIGWTAYARNEDLLVLFGGGRDFVQDGKPNIAGSRALWTCRVQVPGREAVRAADPERISLAAGDKSNLLSWEARENAVYDVFRAECKGLSGRTTTLYSIDSPAIQERLAFVRRKEAAKAAAAAPGADRTELEKIFAEDKLGPDIDSCPGPYEKIGTARAEVRHRAGSSLVDIVASFEDADVAPGAVYAYQVAPGDAGTGQLRSVPAFNQPWHPEGLRASVEDARKVMLRWRTNAEGDLLGYRVYRAIGEEYETGTGRLLTPEPVKATELAVADDDLSDGRVRFYWVTAVNRAGIESGASPLACSFPEAPTALTVVPGEGPSNPEGLLLGYRLRWEWPKDVKIKGFNVYYSPRHFNSFYRKGDNYAADWTKLTKAPQADNEFVFPLSMDDPGSGYYFHVRAVNVLGQEGFYTDIVSPTDFRFRPTP